MLSLKDRAAIDFTTNLKFLKIIMTCISSNNIFDVVWFFFLLEWPRDFLRDSVASDPVLALETFTSSLTALLISSSDVGNDGSLNETEGLRLMSSTSSS